MQQSKPMSGSNIIQLAKNLLNWNKKYLVSSTDLTTDTIGEVFAETFIVRANGRCYDANHDNYLVFLNTFRATIQSIDYNCLDFIVDKNTIALPLTAQIVRTNREEEHFEAILILTFNDADKIILWHEVYVQLS